MTPEERDQFLASQRTCRVATVGAGGRPHVAPLWFVWDGTYLWLSSLTRSQRWSDLMRNARIAIVCDTGHDYAELRGVEIEGTAEPVGAVPWTGGADEVINAVEVKFARKYLGADTPVPPDGRHAWLRITPDKFTSWDFRKLASTGMSRRSDD